MDWMGTPQFRSADEDRGALRVPRSADDAEADAQCLGRSVLPAGLVAVLLRRPQGEKHLRYVPNTSHSLDKTDALETLEAFYAAIVAGTPRPEIRWTFERDGSIKVVTEAAAESRTALAGDEPGGARLPSRRDRTCVPQHAAHAVRSQHVGRARAAAGAAGWTAFFVEMTFPSDGQVPAESHQRRPRAAGHTALRRAEAEPQDGSTLGPLMPGEPGVRAVTALMVTALLFTGAVSASAQTDEAQTILPAIYSSTPMTRNANATFAAAVFSVSALDRGLNAAGLRRLPPDGGRARLLRGAKLALFDVPVVLYFVGINHELGHVARADERGLRLSFALVGTPWSNAQFRLVALDHEIFDDAGSQVGGVEAADRLKTLGEAWMRGVEKIPPGHALATILAALDLPLYALRNLAPGNFDPTLPRGGSPAGDAAQFVGILAEQRALTGTADFDVVRRQVRARSIVNFADFSLWALAYGVVRDHLWTGEDGVRVRWLQLGPVGLIPSVRYEWSPIGPQVYVRSHYRLSDRTGRAYVRWSDRFGDQRLVGFGLSTTGRPIARLKPEVELDIWSHGSHGPGIHGSITAEVPRWPARAAALSVTVGGKSSGYLAAHPLRAGAYVSAGFVVRLW